MQMHITPNNKLASIGTVGLLFLAGIAGMVFLLPVNSAHAASPVVTISTAKSGVLTAVTSIATGKAVVITGTGFSPAAIITITTAVGTNTVAWLTAGTCTTSNGGTGTSNSLTTTTAGPSKCLTTTASGTFEVGVTVPVLPGGANTVTVSDGSLTGTATLTITASVSVTYTGNNFGFPEESISPTIAVTGFASGESVSFATPMWTLSPAASCTTGTTVGSFGKCSVATGATNVAETNGGAKTITATGSTSGLSATTTYTVNPWAAFYNAPTGATTFAFLGNAPTSLLVEAHGLPAGSIGANSITVGGVATSHAGVTIGSSGAIAGAGAQIVLSPTANVPFGPASVVIAGVTFSYAAGNIEFGAGAWSGVLISSIAGTGGAGTGVAVTDASSYKPGGYSASATSPAPQTSEIGIFGYGFVSGQVVVVTAPVGAGAFGVLTSSLTPNGNGAFFETASLADTAWSTALTPGSAASYTVGITEAGGPSNILSPSFGISPWTSTGPTVDYTSTISETGHGFGFTDVLTTTVAGSGLISGGAGFGTCTAVAGTCSTVAGVVPDLASGSQTVTVSGSVTGATATTTATYDINVGTATQTDLSLVTGGAGQTTILRTGAGYGIHGLAANTAYNIVWNAISGSTVVGTFTSTSTGGIPIPGVQVTIPSDSSGIHIFDITTASGASATWGQHLGGDFTPTEAPLSSTYTSQFGDLLFQNVAILSSSPSVATIGSPESIFGTGLAAGQSYVIAIGTGAGTVALTAPAIGTFTATSAGAVPSNVAISLTDTASTTETGTVMYFSVQTAAHFGTTTASDAYAKFVLAANANLNMTSAPPGHSVTLTAHALNSGGVYDIVFNYIQSPIVATSYTGTIVGVVAPNAFGAATANFNTPLGATPGTYVVTLVVATAGGGGLSAGSQVLDNPLSLTVGGTSGTCTNEGTSCMGLSGTPAVTTSGGNKVITATFSNNSNAPQTAYIYGVVHNALGQTVAYTTATVSPNAGASASGQLVLFGLAPGSYSVTLFAVSTSGVALSTTSTVSVTV